VDMQIQLMLLEQDKARRVQAMRPDREGNIQL
jgi:hypothetical protein